MLVFVRCGPAIAVSTGGFSWPSPPPTSIAGPSARRGRPSARTCAFIPARRRPKARVSGPACAAGRSGRRASRSVDAVSRLVGAAIAGIEEHALSSAQGGRTGGIARGQRPASAAGHRVRTRRIADRTGTDAAAAAGEAPARAKPRLSQTDIAFASGFGSVRRFNALFKSRYGLSPRDIARQRPMPQRACTANWNSGRRSPGRACSPICRLRAIPGVEMADATHYRRTVAIDAAPGWIAVSLAQEAATRSNVEMSPSLAPVIGAVIARVKQLFDLGAAPDAVSAHAGRKTRCLPNAVRRIPGLRVAGAFDGFELAVRAILGQQVSVKGATTLAGRWAQAFGDADRHALSGAQSPDSQRASAWPRCRPTRSPRSASSARAPAACSALARGGDRAQSRADASPPNVEEQIEAL